MDPQDNESLKKLHSATFDALEASNGDEAVSAALGMSHDIIRQLLADNAALVSHRDSLERQSDSLREIINVQNQTLSDTNLSLDKANRRHTWEKEIAYSKVLRTQDIRKRMHTYVAQFVGHQELLDLVLELRDMSYMNDDDLHDFCVDSLYEEHHIRGSQSTMDMLWEELENRVWMGSRTVAGRGTLREAFESAKKATTRRIMQRNAEITDRGTNDA